MSENSTSVPFEISLLNSLRIFNRSYMPLVIALGLIGNSLSILVFLTTKLSNVPSSHYLTALAFADSGMLLCQLVVLQGSHLLRLAGFCQLMIYVNNVFSWLSVWYVVSFTIERYIVVCYPLKRLSWCTVRRARVIIFIVTISSSLINIYLIPLLQIETIVTPSGNHTFCKFPDHLLYIGNMFNMLDSVWTLIIPMLLIITFNLRIIHHMMDAFRPSAFLRRNIYFAEDKSNEEATSNGGSSIRSSKRHVTEHRPSYSMAGVLVPRSPSNASSTVVRDEKVTKMLLIVSIVFILTNLPDHVVRTTFLFLKVSGKFDHLSITTRRRFAIVQMITNVIFQSGFAVNFFLYNIVGVNFRRYLKRMLGNALKCVTGRTFFQVKNRRNRKKAGRERDLPKIMIHGASPTTSTNFDRGSVKMTTYRQRVNAQNSNDFCQHIATV